MKIKFGKYSLIYIYTWYTYQFKIIIWFLLKQNETDTEYKREKSETKTIIIKKNYCLTKIINIYKKLNNNKKNPYNSLTTQLHNNLKKYTIKNINNDYHNNNQED